MDFRWNDWNLEHIAKHGIDPNDAELAIESALAPYPTARQDDKWLVWGRGRGGRMIQVVFVLDDDGTVFVIHARPLTDREKQRNRKGNRP